MPKQNNNAGSGTNGPHRQGEKGGKGGSVAKAGRSASGPSKSKTDAIGPSSARDEDKRARTPSVSRKGSETGKGSGNR